jgi:hypothetical protein
VREIELPIISASQREEALTPYLEGEKMTLKNWLNILIVASLVLILSLCQNVYGQWYYSLYLESEFNSNPFGIPEPESDQISKISMGLQKEWEQTAVQYYGSFVNFQQNADRNFYWHQFYAGGGEQTGWNLSLENRINRADYNIYDYFTGRFALNHSILRENSRWRLNGNISLNNFLQIPELNNLFMSAYTSFNRSFITKTSFIGTFSFNYKYYLKEDIPAEPRVWEVVDKEDFTIHPRRQKYPRPHSYFYLFD